MMRTFKDCMQDFSLTNRPKITLLTDFGLTDGFTGVMKGVILQIAPQAVLVDISHDLPAFSIHAACFLNEWSYGYFPAGTVHLCVTDPGVGTERRAIAVETAGHFFVAPDNGLLTPLLKVEEKKTIVSATNPDYWLDSISQTFHGRDIFAPIAAHLANGVSIHDLGDEINDAVELSIEPPLISHDSITCHIRYIDRFGNLVTDLDESRFREWLNQTGCPEDQTIISWPEGRIVGISKAYAEKEEGCLLAVFSGFGKLEIAAREDSAACLTQLGLEDTIRIRKPE